jgi:hypothetical protein
MRLPVSWLVVTLAFFPLAAGAQEQFPNDPLPFTVGPFLNNQFMQLDNISPQRLHLGVDIQTTYPGSDQSVGAPIRFGSDCQVLQIGPDWVRLLARERQNGNLAVFEALHIIPEPTLSVGSWLGRWARLGSVDPAQQHLHAGIFLVAGGTQCCFNTDLVHPQRNAFFLAEGWNNDSYEPKVDLTVVHPATAGNPTVFEIHAYDRADMSPSTYNGIYAIKLFVDDVLVDQLSFDRWRNKSGNAAPTAAEYYYCTAPQCTPSGNNNPSVLQYKLSWTTQPGDHIWRIDVLDAKGNLLHGDPRNGLPGREPPAVSMGGTVQDGRVRLTWRIDPADAQEAGIESFSLWQSRSRLDDFQPASPQPIAAVAGQESYAFDTEAPASMDSVWYRLTAANSVGSTLVLGETQLGMPQLIDGLEGYPNPIVDRLTIALSLTREGSGEIAIFDLGGRRVRLLERGTFKSGVTRLTWDGRDDDGRRLANGVYLLRVTTNGGPTFTARKIALFR